MGGHGSGWYRGKKLTVEQCYALDAPTVAGNRQAAGGHLAPGELMTVSYFRGDKIGPEQIVQLRTTQSWVGGMRWWFACPACGRTVQRLYLPPLPSEQAFACRHCHDLTYLSVQTHSNSFDHGVTRFLARMVGQLTSRR